MEFKERMEQYGKDINAYLTTLCREMSEKGDASYDILFKAMEYSLLAGGKRIRPMLTLEFCRVCGGNLAKAYPLAAAIEMIHTYSLIHDDLPAMDNDDYRRGRLTNHKVFGEGMAVLAGDALLTKAFEVAASADLPPERCLEAVRTLAEAAGSDGMIGGQVIDIENEHKEIDYDTVCKLHRLKTGALIREAARLGCIAAGADEKQRAAADAYAEAIGLAFQIVDDILDVTGDESELGKPVGSDAESGKTTFVTLLGAFAARQKADELTKKAMLSAESMGDGDFLMELASALLNRRK